MKVLMVSKACVVGAYQTKLEAIGQTEDIDLTVVVPPVWKEGGGDLILERCHVEGYDMRVEPIRFNGRFHFHYYPTLRRIIRDLQPDIVHLDEEPYSYVTFDGLRHAKSVDARTLFFSWQNLTRNYPPPFRWIEQHVLNSVDYALMGNNAAEQVWRNKGYQGKSQVLPQFGVSMDLFKPKLPTPNVAKPFVIGSASRRLKHEKGVDLILRAAARLTGDWCVHIAGDGGARDELTALAASLGISDRVRFIGKIGSEEMNDFLQTLDVMVLPSRTMPTWKEQFGRVIIEAMACGVPVIGSDSGEIPHVIGDAGLVFPEDDLDALTAHLLRLKDSAELQIELSQKGRQRVMNQYTQAQIAAKTVAVYRSLFSN